MIISSRTSRCGSALLVGLTALSLAACGSSSTPTASSSKSTTASTATSATSPTSPSPAPAAAGKDHAAGLISSVSGGAVALTGPHGPATVDVTPSTRVVQVTAAQLTDVAVGECVVVRPTRDSSKPPAVTAAAVLVGAPDNGQCGRPGAGQHGAVTGTVAAVNGNAISLTTADQGSATVTVTPATRYAKRSVADTSVLAAGQCLAARGSKDGNGTLQATSVNVRPSMNGRCGGRQG